MKLLVTGAAGYLGSEVCRLAEERGDDVLAARFRTPPPFGRPLHLDVRDEAEVQRVLMRHGPELVVHTAYVQSGPLMADTIVRGSRAVAAAAHRAGVRLVHLSTDLVFDGEHGAPYTEDADPRPVVDYGAAKLEAERLVARAHPDALLVRTSLLYGKPGPQEALALQEGVELYTDEIRCPTLVDELAVALLELGALELAGPLHVAAPDACSRYAFARLLRTAAGVDPEGVRAGLAPWSGRARNVALDSSKAAELLVTRLRGVAETIGLSA